MTFFVKGGKHQDAEEFLSLYLEALDEELIDLHMYISKHKLASTASIKEPKDATQQAGNRTEVGKRDDTVRQLSFLSLI